MKSPETSAVKRQMLADGWRALRSSGCVLPAAQRAEMKKVAAMGKSNLEKYLETFIYNDPEPVDREQAKKWLAECLQDRVNADAEPVIIISKVHD